MIWEDWKEKHSQRYKTQTCSSLAYFYLWLNGQWQKRLLNIDVYNITWKASPSPCAITSTTWHHQVTHNNTSWLPFMWVRAGAGWNAHSCQWVLQCFSEQQVVLAVLGSHGSPGFSTGIFWWECVGVSLFLFLFPQSLTHSFLSSPVVPILISPSPILTSYPSPSLLCLLLPVESWTTFQRWSIAIIRKNDIVQSFASRRGNSGKIKEEVRETSRES